MGNKHSVRIHPGLGRFDNCVSCDPSVNLNGWRPTPGMSYNKMLPAIPSKEMMLLHRARLNDFANNLDLWTFLPRLNGQFLSAKGVGVSGDDDGYSVNINTCDSNPVTRVVTITNIIPFAGPAMAGLTAHGYRTSLSGIAARTSHPKQIILTGVTDQFGRGYPDTALTVLNPTGGDFGLLLENANMLYVISPPR